jgi:hypothetical protein
LEIAALGQRLHLKGLHGMRIEILCAAIKNAPTFAIRGIAFQNPSYLHLHFIELGQGVVEVGHPSTILLYPVAIKGAHLAWRRGGIDPK